MDDLTVDEARIMWDVCQAAANSDLWSTEELARLLSGLNKVTSRVKQAEPEQADV